MEELVALLTRNLEADETEAFSRNNGPVTLGTKEVLLEIHKSPPKTHCSFLHDGAADCAFRFWPLLPGFSPARAAQAKSA